MFWASAPVFSDKYELRVGDGKSANFPRTYEPGKLHDIWIKVLHREYTFRGLLMKAVLINNNNATTGTWVFPGNDDSAHYWSPPSAALSPSCAGSVFHTSAEEKPLSSLVRWKAPPAGTGTVVFQALIKQGPANRGSFYLAELTLREGAAAGAQTWFKGAKGQSCDQVCKAQGMSCQASAMKAADSGAKLTAAVHKDVVCDRPLFSGCPGAAGPAAFSPRLSPFVTSTDVCYFHDSDCGNNVDCGASSTDVAQLCACGAARRRLLAPVGATTAAATAAAGSATSAAAPGVAPSRGMLHTTLLAAASLLLLRGSGSGSRPASPALTGLLLLALLCLSLGPRPAAAHNWYRSESRSSKAAVSTRPCKPRIGKRFHVQVGPAQEFSVAWATGHGHTVTAAIVAAKDLDKVKNKQVYLAAIKDYIASAPASANLLTNKKWQRTHGMPGDPILPAGVPAPAPFVRQILKTDPLWHMSTILQEERFNGKSNQVYEFAPADMASDKRVEYKSAKYPWIVSALQMPITKVNFGQFDQVLVRIPADYPPGHYVVAWDWQGYNDCVDVEVRSAPVQYVNGKGSTDFIYKRVEHCAYVNPRRLITGCAMPSTSFDNCTKDLAQWTDTQRVGFTVSPALAPPQVASFLQDNGVNSDVPWKTPECGTSDILSLSGKETNSYDSSWESGWMANANTEAGMRCSGTLFTLTDKRDAVLACADKRCLGIAVSTTAPSQFIGCRTTRGGGADWTLYSKKVAGVSFDDLRNAPASSFASTPAVSISFQAPTASVGLPSGMVADTGAVYGSKPGGLSYGWTCPHTQFGSYSGAGNTAEGTYAESFWKPCGGSACNAPNSGWAGPNLPAGCSRNKWEVAVPNGWYKVEAKSVRLTGCGFEGVNPTVTTSSSTYLGMDSSRAFVQVKDGRFTISDSGWRGCCDLSSCFRIATLKLFRLTDGALTPTPVWMPSQTNPWWQLELSEPTAVGYVSIKNPTGRCPYNWLYKSDDPTCLDASKGQAKAYFDGAGAVVGVSNTPCSGTSCSGGTVCGAITRSLVRQQQVGLDHAVPVVNQLLYRHYVNCSGAVGKYIYVQLPGPRRIFATPRGAITAYRPKPVDSAATRAKPQFVCVGYRAVANPDEANPEVRTTNDPENPMFYSTCLVRERNLVFLPPEGGAGATLAINEPYVFQGQCLDCAAYNSSLSPNPHLPLFWNFTDKCKACRNPLQLAATTTTSANTLLGLGGSAAAVVGAVSAGAVFLIAGVVVAVVLARRRASGAAYPPKNQSTPATTATTSAYEMRPATTTQAAFPAAARTAPPAAALPPSRLPPSRLPPNWQEQQDQSGATYYWNTVTNQTSWDRPTGY